MHEISVAVAVAVAVLRYYLRSVVERICPGQTWSRVGSCRVVFG